MNLSQEQRFQIWISVASVILTALIAGGSIAYASGVTANRVRTLEEQMGELKKDWAESLNELRLGVNRIDDRTRELEKSLSRLEGRLTK